MIATRQGQQEHTGKSKTDSAAGHLESSTVVNREYGSLNATAGRAGVLRHARMISKQRVSPKGRVKSGRRPGSGGLPLVDDRRHGRRLNVVSHRKTANQVVRHVTLLPKGGRKVNHRIDGEVGLTT